MKIVGRADIDDVDAGIGGQGFVASVAAGDAEARAEPLRGGGSPRTDGRDLGVRAEAQAPDERIRDRSRAQDAPADLRIHAGFL